MTTTIQRVEGRSNVIVMETFCFTPLLEELTTTFPVSTETKVGHVSDDLTVSFELCDVGNDGPGDRSLTQINSKDPTTTQQLSFLGYNPKSTSQLEWRFHPNWFEVKVAEREGFEPSVDFRLHMISNHAHSTTLPPLRIPETRVVRWSKGR